MTCSRCQNGAAGRDGRCASCGVRPFAAIVVEVDEGLRGLAEVLREVNHELDRVPARFAAALRGRR